MIYNCYEFPLPVATGAFFLVGPLAYFTSWLGNHDPRDLEYGIVKFPRADQKTACYSTGAIKLPERSIPAAGNTKRFPCFGSRSWPLDLASALKGHTRGRCDMVCVRSTTSPPQSSPLLAAEESPEGFGEKPVSRLAKPRTRPQ